MPANFKLIPLSVIQSWPKPNYVDPIRKTYMPQFALTWQVASTILISARLYLRVRKQAGGLGLDDLMISIGYVVSVGFTAMILMSTQRYNVDRHTWDVPLDLYTSAALAGWIAQILFICSTIPTKLAVLLFYRRMVKDSIKRRWLYTIYGALFVTAAYGVAVLGLYLAACQPLESVWLSYDFDYDKEYKCIDGSILLYTAGLGSVVSDIYTVALPSLMLRHYDLNVPRKQKIALNIILASGFLVGGAGVARTYYLWKLYSEYDTSWNGFDLSLWSLVECQLGIILACLPTVRAFVRRYLRDKVIRTLSSSASHQTQRDSGTGLRGNGCPGVSLEAKAMDIPDHDRYHRSVSPLLPKPAFANPRDKDSSDLWHAQVTSPALSDSKVSSWQRGDYRKPKEADGFDMVIVESLNK